MKQIVIKLGTQVVVEESTSGIALTRLEAVVQEVSILSEKGIRVSLVSSGAVGLGKKVLGLNTSLGLTDKQACAAVGQSELMSIYSKLFSKYNLTVAQILVTAHDFATRERYLNLKNTFERLQAQGVIPTVNENDVVSAAAGIIEDSSKRSFDDNDKLSALVAGKLGADVLLILTNVDGVYDCNPLENPNAKLIPQVSSFSQLSKISAVGLSHGGRGGMASKLEASRLAALCGVKTIIANGFGNSPILSTLERKSGTEVMPLEALSSRKRWIGIASGYCGIVTVNTGAKDMLENKRASLLPVGIVEVQGDFEPHDVVSIQDSLGSEIGRGLAAMSARTLRLVKGQQSAMVKVELAEGEKEEVVHRDNLVLFGAA